MGPKGLPAGAFCWLPKPNMNTKIKGAFKKFFSLLVQIVGVIVTIVAITFVRVYLQKGYRLEVYAFTVGLIALIVVIWFIRTWWLNKRERNTQQEKLFSSKEHKLKSLKTPGQVLFFILILSILVGLFYWYEVRPSRARAECDLVAREKANATSSPTKYYDTFYEACLHSKGME